MADNATATLRVLPTWKDATQLVAPDNTRTCDDSYSCECLQCQLDRVRAIRRGVRSDTTRGIPIKTRRAA